MRVSLISLTAVLVLAGCSSAKPRPTGAGSTSVLRLLRDWRGVWTGKATDSPMGPMTYTVYVEPRGDQLQMRLARQTTPGLEDMRHVYELRDFTTGTPRIRFALTQRSATQRGEVVYRDDLSTDEAAVFCQGLADCDKLQLTMRQLDERSLAIQTLVHESFHSEIVVRYTSAKIPREAPADSDTSRAQTPTKEVQREPRKGGEPIDEDLYLEEHLDEDIGEPNQKPERGNLEDSRRESFEEPVQPPKAKGLEERDQASGSGDFDESSGMEDW